MTKLSLGKALSNATSHIKKGEVAEAQILLSAILKVFPDNKKAQKKLASLPALQRSNCTNIPTPLAISELTALYNAGDLTAVIERADALTQQYPSAHVVWNILGAASAQKGLLDKAIIAFRKVVILKPDYAAAYNNLGNTLIYKEQFEEAIENFQKALKLEPHYDDAWFNLGNAYKELEQLDDAIRAYQEAISINPNHAEAYNNMGNILYAKGELENAIKLFKSALNLKFDYVDAWFNLGNVLREIGDLEEALTAYRKLTSTYSHAAEAYNEIGNILIQQGNLQDASRAFNTALKIKPDFFLGLFNLANIFKANGEFANAIQSYQKAIEINPNYAEAYNNLANTFAESNKCSEAIKAYRKAITVNPGYAEAYNNLAVLFKDEGKSEEAVQALQSAVRQKPDYAEAWFNLGNIFKEQRILSEAEAAYNKAIAIKPDFADAYNNLGRLYWIQENFTDAFDLLEWRWLKEDHSLGNQYESSKSSWSGDGERKIFVWKEQGIGDEIMLSSMLSELNAASEQLIVECDTRLIPLYKRSFPDSIRFLASRTNVQETDYDDQIALGSLPKFLRKKLSDFSSTSNGWLAADPDKVDSLKVSLQADKSEKIIGISWFTNAVGARSKQRSVSLHSLTDYLEQIPATFVNLQYGVTADQLAELNNNMGIHIKNIHNLDLYNDIDGLAALISACDLVISVDNLTVHLAGALGVDTRVLLPKVADERWGLQRTDSYWYDSLTLYRQEDPNNWNKPLDDLVNDLSQI